MDTLQQETAAVTFPPVSSPPQLQHGRQDMCAEVGGIFYFVRLAQAASHRRQPYFSRTRSKSILTECTVVLRDARTAVTTYTRARIPAIAGTTRNSNYLFKYIGLTVILALSHQFGRKRLGKHSADLFGFFAEWIWSLADPGSTLTSDGRLPNRH